MVTVDADAHVIEGDSTWAYLPEDDKRFKPRILVQIESGNTDAATEKWWMFDSNFTPAHLVVNEVDIAVESRELTSVAHRLAHMDELDIDVQVLYPTIFLNPCFDDAAGELALYRAYNRWMADIWKQAPNRLRWAAAIPLNSMHKVREEIAFCKEHGAVSIFLRPYECERVVFDPFFYPLYEFAQKFDLAITIHSGIGSANLKRILLPHFFSIFRASLVNCFHAIVLSELPKKFPGVRWGIIEGRAGWLPWIVSDLQKRFHKQGKRIGPDLLKDNNIFVTLELEDDLSEIIKCVGDDNLIIGTDYGHCDTSAEIEALRILAENGKVPKSSVDKILGPNAERLYKI